MNRDILSDMHALIDKGIVVAYALGYYVGRSGADGHTYNDEDRTFWYRLGHEKGAQDHIAVDMNKGEEPWD